MNLELMLVFRRVPEGYIVEELPGANERDVDQVDYEDYP
jgi:hypothetical protein